MIQLELFLNFMQVGAFSVGGGYAAIPLIRSIAVEQHTWLTAKEFSDLIIIAEMTPGPIAVNSATFVGLRLGGFAGAVCATLGCILPSLILVTLLSILYVKNRKNKTMQMVLQVMRAIMVALIASAALSLIKAAVTVDGRVVGLSIAMFLAALAILRMRKTNPILVMTGCGICAALLHTVKLM